MGEGRGKGEMGREYGVGDDDVEAAELLRGGLDGADDVGFDAHVLHDTSVLCFRKDIKDMRSVRKWKCDRGQSCS